MPETVFEVDSDYLNSLPDHQLIEYAGQYLSLVFAPGTPRTLVLQKIISSSLVVADV